MCHADQHMYARKEVEQQSIHRAVLQWEDCPVSPPVTLSLPKWK